MNNRLESFSPKNILISNYEKINNLDNDYNEIIDSIDDIVSYDNFKIHKTVVSKYENINDLYVISDLLITDYSSVFFDKTRCILSYFRICC